MRQPSKARNIAFMGILFGLALALSYAESFLTPLLGLPPGVKIGLANVVVVYALLFINRPSGLTLVVLKAGFALLTRGGIAALLSAAGGLLSLAVSLVLLLLFADIDLAALSVAGAVAHNAGQLLVIQFTLGRVAGYYFPVLLLSGIVMGLINATLLKVLIPAMEKSGLGQKQKK